MDFDKLKLDAQGIGVLYVEDNEAMRLSTSKILKEVFDTVYIAVDGKEGLELYKKHRPQIVITGIKMSNLNGLELGKHIRKISSSTKIIILSAFDSQEFLYQAIEIGVLNFLKKPINHSTLVGCMKDTVNQIHYENNIKLFYSNLENTTDSENLMIVMLSDKEPVFANENFLDFFDVENIKEFTDKYPDIGVLFLENKGFLYNTQENNSLDKIRKTPDEVYHIKMKDKEEKIKHFMIKYKNTQSKDNYGMLTFNDVTDFNFLELFEEGAIKDNKRKDKIFNIFDVLKKNSAKLCLYNYYKGLRITSDASVMDIKEDSIVLKTNYAQQKSLESKEKTFIVSEAFPYTVVCEKVVNVGYKKQSVEFKDIYFIETSPVLRQNIRVIPDERHTATLFIEHCKAKKHLKIEDISINAVKLKVDHLPEKVKEGDKVFVDMVLTLNKNPLIVNTEATIFKKKRFNGYNELVLTYQLSQEKEKELIEYITKKLMYVIKEFKKLQNE